jgi:tRNA pseudouridine55 synthase
VSSERSARSGILLIDKPKGFTSHDVVAKVRRLADTRKVGHAGTLDPMATGLLILGIGTATRLLTFVVGLDKEYLATIRLGQSTTTDDAEGEVVSGSDASGLALPALTNAIGALSGAISQVPSSVSAIKVNGKRAYALARAGESVILESRSVTITEFELLGHTAGPVTDLDVRIVCSSGTYVRALARDLGAALGVGGHVTALRRTRVGPFFIADSKELDELDVTEALVKPSDAASQLFPVLALDEQLSIDLTHGKKVPADGEGTFAATAPDGRLIGITMVNNGSAWPIVNFPEDGSPA